MMNWWTTISRSVTKAFKRVRKCKCGELAGFFEEMETLHGRVKYYYCEECWVGMEKKREQDLVESNLMEQMKFEVKKKKERLEHLKLEVELAEYERRAKVLGIGSD